MLVLTSSNGTFASYAQVTAAVAHHGMAAVNTVAAISRRAHLDIAKGDPPRCFTEIIVAAGKTAVACPWKPCTGWRRPEHPGRDPLHWSSIGGSRRGPMSGS